jgi:hypothetical protein
MSTYIAPTSTYIVVYKCKAFSTNFASETAAHPPQITWQLHHLRLCVSQQTINQNRSVLSATPEKETDGRKYFTFPFAAVTTTKLPASNSIYSHFSYCTTRQRYDVTFVTHVCGEVFHTHIKECRLSYRPWSHARRHAERYVTALFSRRYNLWIK